MQSPIETIEALTSRLRARRKSLGLSQEDLAARLSVSPALLCKWERSKITPAMGRYLQWAQTLGVELYDIEQHGKVIGAVSQ